MGTSTFAQELGQNLLMGGGCYLFIYLQCYSKLTLVQREKLIKSYYPGFVTKYLLNFCLRVNKVTLKDFLIYTKMDLEQDMQFVTNFTQMKFQNNCLP